MVLDNIRLDMLVRDKHSSLLDSFVEEIEVLRIWSLTS
jgi:hypothetical protein